MLSLDATIDKNSTGHSEQQQTETRLARSLKELQTYLIKVLHLHLFIFRWQIFKNFLTQLSHLISGHLSQLVGSCRMKLADFWHGWILLPRWLHEKLEDEVGCFCVASEGFLFGFTFSCQQQRVAENGGGLLLWRFCQSKTRHFGSQRLPSQEVNYYSTYQVRQWSCNKIWLLDSLSSSSTGCADIGLALATIWQMDYIHWFSAQNLISLIRQGLNLGLGPGLGGQVMSLPWTL